MNFPESCTTRSSHIYLSNHFSDPIFFLFAARNFFLVMGVLLFVIPVLSYVVMDYIRRQKAVLKGHELNIMESYNSSAN